MAVQLGGVQVLCRSRLPQVMVKRCVSWMNRNSGLVALASMSRYCNNEAGGPSLKYIHTQASSCSGQSRMRCTTISLIERITQSVFTGLYIC